MRDKWKRGEETSIEETRIKEKRGVLCSKSRHFGTV